MQPVSSLVPVLQACTSTTHIRSPTPSHRTPSQRTIGVAVVDGRTVRLGLEQQAAGGGVARSLLRLTLRSGQLLLVPPPPLQQPAGAFSVDSGPMATLGGSNAKVATMFCGIQPDALLYHCRALCGACNVQWRGSPNHLVATSSLPPRGTSPSRPSISRLSTTLLVLTCRRQGTWRRRPLPSVRYIANMQQSAPFLAGPRPAQYRLLAGPRAGPDTA